MTEERKKLNLTTKIISLSALSALLIGVLFSVVSLSAESPSASSPGVSLGTWLNFPSSCSSSFDDCELMGNHSYRQVLATASSTGESGLLVQLSVGCILPSVSIFQPQLTLQYANYSRSTGLNTSNFAILAGAAVSIDNSANHPCPGTLISTSANLPSIVINPADFIFRVIGTNGNGAGDNPRFSYISVLVSQRAQRTYMINIPAPGTSTFVWTAYSNFPVPSSTTFTMQWSASNITTTACGISVTVTLNHCWEQGTSSCTFNSGAQLCSAGVTVTYNTAFTGTVRVQGTSRNGATVLTIPLMSLSMFQTETVIA